MRADSWPDTSTSRAWAARLVTFAFAALLCMLPIAPGMTAMAQQQRFYKTRDAAEVQAFVQTHRKSVFVFGSAPLTTDFEASLLEGVLRERSSVKVITGAADLPRFKALIKAGAQVRYRVSQVVSKNGYVNTVALFEDRWLLVKNQTEWQLLDSPEAVAQVKARLELFWSYCQPAKP